MITFTDRAREMLTSFLVEGEPQALRITMSGGSAAPSFDLILVDLEDLRDDERKVEGDGFPVFIRESDYDALEGATIDYEDRVTESGFAVRTAQQGQERKTGARRGGEPHGPLADKVREVLDSQVNPAIAAHGGLISLVDVEEMDVYVEMSGGCQGCALSRMTLRQGVERMLREAVPELTAVHDVTDHASGENPYL